MWADPALMLGFELAGLLVLRSILLNQRYLRRRFNRRYSPPLMLAVTLVCGLMAWGALVILPADGSFHAAGGTALPKLAGVWQHQIRVVDAQAAELRAHPSRELSRVLPVTTTEPANGALDADLAAAADTGGLPVGIPILTVMIAALTWLGIKPRLDEYRE